MPGPGSQRKKKAKAKHANPLGEYTSKFSTAGVDNSEGWDEILSVIRNHFDLPGEGLALFSLEFQMCTEFIHEDLTTRSGLKKVHSNFDTVYGRMDKLYESNMENLKIRGAIALIYAKMCVDTILRDKLFEKGRHFEQWATIS